ncbi:MAG: RING finger protein, partial [Oscillospiraceae bacterium]
MFNYNTQVCEYCHQPFGKDSDIVVCPECGTPHHRHCWQELGHCINEDKHSDAFEWKSTAPIISADSTQCPECGAVMPKDTLFCESCGKSLAAPEKATAPAPVAPSFAGISRDDMTARVEKELSGEIDGVSVKDMAYYIGSGAQYYIFKFRRMKQNPNYKPFCWSAFLASPLYFAYRKMWKPAVLSALFNMLMNFPSLILSMVEIGAISSSSPLVFGGINSLAMVGSLLVLVAAIFLGFMAVPLFKAKVVTEIKALKSACPDETVYRRELIV